MNHKTEAAIDANAPLEDEDDPAAGPVDSDEETAAVMASLSHWAPRPWIDQAPLLPIKRRYQLARLREQLDNATSGGTVNIFRVTSKNGVELPPQGPQGPQVFRDGAGGSVFDGEDAPGEVDYGAGFGGVASRRGSVVGGGGFGAPAIALPQRRGSLVGHA
jgi:SAGA-associated factor 73